MLQKGPSSEEASLDEFIPNVNSLEVKQFKNTLSQAEKCSSTSDYLGTVQKGEIDEEYQLSALDWIVLQCEGLFPNEVQLCEQSTELLLLCLKTFKFPSSCLKIVAVTCMYISLKQQLPLSQIPSIVDLLDAILSESERSKIRPETIAQMEIVLCTKLGWDLIVPTPFEISSRLLTCATDIQEQGCSVILDTSTRFAKCLLRNIESAATSPTL